MTAALTLRAFVAPTGVSVSHVCGGIRLQIASDGAQQTLYRDHVPTGHTWNWHPAHWWGNDQRRDQHGNEWHRVLPRQVMDDFGFLVEVPQ
jgi:hypothetical protein